GRRRRVDFQRPIAQTVHGRRRIACRPGPEVAMDSSVRGALTKVPAVTLGFCIIKILATTLGETGGDSVSMSWLGETTPEAGAGGLNGYLVGSAIFGVALIVVVALEVRVRAFNT